MSSAPPTPAKGPRWWPLIVLVAGATTAIAWLRSQELVPYQQRNLQTASVLMLTSALILLWWLFFSRVRWRTRFLGLLGVGLIAAASAAAFRIRGVTGDLVPILEPRWAASSDSPSTQLNPLQTTDPARADASKPHPPANSDFPQFGGPNRNFILQETALNPDWTSHPPSLLWRQKIGAAWSGFAVAGPRAVTQEQRGDAELITCYDATSGRLLWQHAEPERYQTTIAGEGPRCTPTIAGNQVLALGATGVLNCLDLHSGRQLWRRHIAQDAAASMPGWGFAGSPLIHDQRVVVSAGGSPDKSLLAYNLSDGSIAWTGGNESTGYSSPVLISLAGHPQILSFNARKLSAHDPASGKVLWDYACGIGQPHVALPIPVGPSKLVFSAGYGVGAELLEIKRSTNGAFTPEQLWKSIRMKAKFANWVLRDGFLYGLDDGMMACVDSTDGSQRWKQGRHGHGQGLLIDDLYLLMAEDGELILMRPTPETPGELHRFRVFNSKTWNPIALAGDLLLVRNDLEAACLRLALAPRSL